MFQGVIGVCVCVCVCVFVCKLMCVCVFVCVCVCARTRSKRVHAPATHANRTFNSSPYVYRLLAGNSVPVKILEGPRNQTLYVGQAANITCLAQVHLGFVVLTHNEKVLEEATFRVPSTDRALRYQRQIIVHTLASVRLSDAGEYSCYATDLSGRAGDYVDGFVRVLGKIEDFEDLDMTGVCNAVFGKGVRGWERVE